jgi:hypothetical protein
MKKVLVCSLVLMFCSSNAFAILSDPNINTNSNLNSANAASSAISTSASSSNSIAAQGQLQGQVQGQLQSTESSSDNAVSVSGDKNRAYGYAHSSTNPAIGTESVSVGSILGGVAWTDDNELTKIQTRIKVLKEINRLNEDELDIAYEDIKRATRAPRYLGIFKSSGRKSLLNLFGLLLF